MTTGQSIANSMGAVSTNISKIYTNPEGNYSTKFKNWNATSGDALKGAMVNAGLHRENFADDTAALQALVTKNAASEGALAATKTLGEINSAQVMESIKLRELISSQQLAATAYMLTQTSKSQAASDRGEAIAGPSLVTMPGPSKVKTYTPVNVLSK